MKVASAFGVFLLLQMPAALAEIPSSTRCPGPGFPPDSKIQVITDHSRVDGLPMLILQLQNKLTGKQLLAWYEKRWAGSRKIPRAIRYQSGPWMVVAHKKAGCFETVQTPYPYTPTGPTYLAVSRPNHEVRANPNFPMPGGSRVLLTMDNGGPSQAHNILLDSPDSPRQTARFYRKTLLHQGWALQMDQSISSGESLMFQKGSQHVEISLDPASLGSHVFLTIAQG